jgi:biopolymer transport protein ExbB
MNAWLSDPLAAIRDFLAAGGPVLWVILFTALLLWTLIIERYWFLRITWPQRLRQVEAAWMARSGRHDWYAERIREALLSELTLALHQRLLLIKALVALCPLLGLLGTVWGMVQVFDTLAVTGSGNPRLMAAGISMATIPTMAGMVVAISGLYFSARLRFHADHRSELAADRLLLGDATEERSR